MICVHTGCHVHVKRRGLFFHGDLFLTRMNSPRDVVFFEDVVDDPLGVQTPPLTLALKYRECPPTPVLSYPAVHVMAEVEDEHWQFAFNCGVLFLDGQNCRYLGYGGMSREQYIPLHGHNTEIQS